MLALLQKEYVLVMDGFGGWRTSSCIRWRIRSPGLGPCRLVTNRVEMFQNKVYQALNVLKRSVLAGPKLFDAKCTRLACLLSFASLFFHFVQKHVIKCSPEKIRQCFLFLPPLLSRRRCDISPSETHHAHPFSSDKCISTSDDCQVVSFYSR